MKNKIKSLLLVCLIVFLTSACTSKEQENENEKNTNGTEISSEYLTSLEILRYQVSDYTMPAFTLKVNGIVEKTINSNSLSSLKMYDFITYKVGPYIINSEERYSGIRLVDVLDYLGIDEYSEITFTDFENGDITLPASKIDENSYLAFYQDSELLGTDKVNVVIPAFIDMFWAEGITSITITK
jgi:hypothetical protein